MPDDTAAFDQACRQRAAAMAKSPELRRLSAEWLDRSALHRYSYNFRWLGLPIVQYPQDIVAMQEILWDVRPDVVIETGVAHGGSLVLHASILELLGGERLVIGIDVDIRPENRHALETHPLAHRIRLLEGSSTDADIIELVRTEALRRERVLVALDSDHTHAHVLAELEAYAPLVTEGSYLVVFDTAIDGLPPERFPDRAWGPGDNPATAVQAFLARDDRFTQDESITDRLLISVAPGGYLRCVAPRRS